MARHYPDDPRVQTVIEGLVDAFLCYGSVRSVAEALSRETGQTVYPNRIHGLLSLDRNRSINTSTLELLEQGLDSLSTPDDAESTRMRVEDEIRRTSTVNQALAGPTTIQEAGDIPGAVLERFLAPTALGLAPSGEDRVPTGIPDWTWQDTAVRQIGQDLAASQNPVLGVVIPTGGGKTRVGLRAALDFLHQSGNRDKHLVWVTHRVTLQTQARRQLQRLLREDEGLPRDASSIFDDRIHFVSIGRFSETRRTLGEKIGLIVLDEAHHAPAPSYSELVDSPHPKIYLTATPVRLDQVDIGLTKVSFAITYKELFRRYCLVEPKFLPPLDVFSLDWSTTTGLQELADYLLDHTERDFHKVLVATSKQERAEILCRTLQELLLDRPGHPLTATEIGYVHGGGNSVGARTPTEALDETQAWPAGIVISTHQLIGEGYDDPTIDSVVVTFPSTSIANLMQVAGRALRAAPGKTQAYVVQVRDSALQYYFNQRWLYQDISDRLRPDLLDIPWQSTEQLRTAIDEVLTAHQVPDAVRQRIRLQINQLAADTLGPPSVRLLLCGMNYYGPKEDFGNAAKWNAILVTDSDWTQFLQVFNQLSDSDEIVRDPHAFLARFISPDSRPDSSWKSYMDLVNAASYARDEISGYINPGSSHRSFTPGTHTSWLRYITFNFRPEIPPHLSDFLADAVNRHELFAQYIARSENWAAAVRLHLPLGGFAGYLLDRFQLGSFVEVRASLSEQLSTVEPMDQFAGVAAWRTQQMRVEFPLAIFDRLEVFMPAPALQRDFILLGESPAHEVNDQEK
jgi:superfamily II DNA or RNA helicase